MPSSVDEEMLLGNPTPRINPAFVLELANVNRTSSLRKWWPHLTLDSTPDFILEEMKRFQVDSRHGRLIGNVARQTGLSVDAIRFYEREGLLRVAMRSVGNFRLYEASDVEQLQFIRRSQELGFSLQEIRELLIIRNERTEACTHVRDLIVNKLQAVRSRLEQLTNLQHQLERALETCAGTLAKSADQEHESCPVLQGIVNRTGEAKS